MKFRTGQQSSPDAGGVAHRVRRAFLRLARRLSGGDVASDRHEKVPVDMHDWDIADLALKLRKGFGRTARSDLLAILASDSDPERRSFAAWELARFDATRGDWESSLRFLDQIFDRDPRLLATSSAGLLFVEALAEQGRFDDARRFIREAKLSGQADIEYALALSNVCLGSGEDRAAGSAGETGRLVFLNALYEPHDLARLEIADPASGYTPPNLAAGRAALPPVDDSATVSVVTAMSSAGPQDGSAIERILEQTWRNLELIVVEYGSDDSRGNVLEPIAARDARLRSHCLGAGKGLRDARQAALALATGEYVLTWNDRLFAHPQMLHALVHVLRSDAEARIVLPGTVDVTDSMRFGLAAHGDVLSYVTRPTDTWLARRQDIETLGEWDDVGELADAEFLQRAAICWGEGVLVDVRPAVPLAFRRRGPDEIARLSEPGATYADPGAADEYLAQAAFWATRGCGLPACDDGRPAFRRTDRKRPFPAPRAIYGDGGLERPHYDLVIVSDLTLMGGTRRCNEGYVDAATSRGMTVGLANWPRYDLRLRNDVAGEYRHLNEVAGVDIITAHDAISTELLLIHHPPIMNVLPDRTADVRANKVAVLVNQLPEIPGDPDGHYYRQDEIVASCHRLFGRSPVWIPISPLVRRKLGQAGIGPLLAEDWIPPLGKVVNNHDPASAGTRRHDRPVIGRHSRDHWTKWPASEAELRSAYCADSSFEVRFLGGTRYARGILAEWPGNWTDLPFDSEPVSDFLLGLDFFVHFTHADYVEEFGRNVMEAMAAGIPALVPHRFREVFGDAACYCDADRVEERILGLWHDRSAYLDQVRRGVEYVRNTATRDVVAHRLLRAVKDETWGKDSCLPARSGDATR